MEISDERLIQLFTDVSSAREKLDTASRRLDDVVELIEGTHRRLQDQIDEQRETVEDRLARLEQQSSGNRKFLRGVSVGASLVSGGLGSGLTLLARWVGTRH